MAAVVIDAAYLFVLWPDWDELRGGRVPQSAFIKAYLDARDKDPKLPPLRWQPVSMSSLPKYVPRAFVLAEDAAFYVHSGVDWEGVKAAAQKNLERGEFTHGGSSITQQTVKNLFLSSSRSPLRKWHELVLTWAMERQLDKQRILGLYVNLVELGRGVYGVQAAAQRYYGVNASALTLEQAAELAATLPSPILHNPHTRTRAFTSRLQRVLRWLEKFGAS